MDEEIKEVGEMATIEGEEEITINEDYTTLEAETIIIDDDSNIQTDAEYEQAVAQKELADEAREALSAVLLSVLEKGEINDDDIAEIAAQQEIYTENVTALKILGLTTEDEKSTTNVITSNIDYNELIKVLSEKADWLYIDEDGQVMLNGEVVPKLKVVELEAEKIKADVGEFKNLTTENFTATNATIESLKANKANITDLNATNAEITNLKANKADITFLKANYATIHQLDATNANVTNLQADTANINNALINKANVVDLNATNANVANLQATKANITDLNAANANINTLTGNLADITTLINGNLTSDNIQSMAITGDKFTVANGFIKNAMIDSISANKINTGAINTNNVSIQSADGSMVINGTTQQFKDKNNKVRIQIGKDAQGNFTFALFSQDGVGVLIDETGIKSGAVPNGLIVNDMVSNNANISGSKLDINSVISSINNGTTVIKGTRIQLDEQGQSLQVAFSQLKNKIETIENISIEGDLSSVIEQVTSNTTSINTMQGQISSLISNTTITKANGEVVQLKDEYNSTKSTVDSHSTKIGSLETNLATANNNISSVSSKQTALEQNLNGFKQTVSDTYTTKADFSNLNLGGRNFILNSNFKDAVPNEKNVPHWSFWGNVKVYAKQGMSGYNKINTLYLANNTTTSSGIYQDISSDQIPKNTQITVSYDMAREGNVIDSYVTLEFYDANNKKIASNTLSNAIGHVAKTVTTPNSNYHNMRLVITHKGSNSTDASYLVTIGNIKLEKGNKATDWTPAPEDIDNSIAGVDAKFNNYSTTSQINSAITQKANEITSTVSQTYATKAALNTVDNKFANYSTTSAMNSAISQKSDAILSTVSKTYATQTSLADVSNNLKNNYSTTSAMNSAINQKANEITSSVSQTYATKSEFNGLSIGGRNYLSRTSIANTTTISSLNSNNYYTYDPYTTSGNKKLSEYGLVAGNKLTVSFDYKVTNVTTYGKIRVELLTGNNTTSTYVGGYETKDITSSSTSGRYVATLTLNDSTVTACKLRIRVDNGKFTLTISNVKMEKGDKPTAWTPSPEDIDNAISTVDNKFVNYSTTSQMNSAINQKANEITSSVSQTYATKTALNTVDGKFANYSTTSQMNTAINQKAGSITQSVSSTYATKTALNSANDNISSLTNRMSSAESKLTKDSLTTTIGNYYTTSNDVNGLITSKGYATTSQVNQTATDLTAKFTASGGYNLIENSGALFGVNNWFHPDNANNKLKAFGIHGNTDAYKTYGSHKGFYATTSDTTEKFIYSKRFLLKSNTKYTLSGKLSADENCKGIDVYMITSESATGASNEKYTNACSFRTKTWWKKFTYTFTTGDNVLSGCIRIDNNGSTTSGTDAYIYFGDLQLEEGEVAHPWSPHPNEVRSGITQIDATGIKVYHNSINSNSYTHMTPAGFYIKNKGTDIFKVDTNGLYLKGKAEITSGSMPSTLLTGTIDNARLNSTIVNGANNGTSAKSTLDSKANGWDSTKSTVDNNKTNWSNAYNRVVDWAYGAVGGRTTINGGLLQTNTVTAQHLAIGDFNNYSQLVPGQSLSNRYGYASWSGSGDHFYWANGDSEFLPFTINETVNPFKQGDKVGFKFEAYVQAEMDVTIGIWFYSSDDANGYMTQRTTGVHLKAGWNSYSTQVTIDCNEVKWAKSVAIMINKGASNHLEVRNVLVARMINNVMIEDGAITADKIAANAITGKTITGSIFKSGTDYNPNKQNITGLQIQDDMIYSYGTKNNGMYAVTKIAGGTINIGNGEDGAGLNWSAHISPSDISLFKQGSTGYFYVGTTEAPGSGYSTTTTTIDTTTINIGSKDTTTAFKVDYNGNCEFGNNYFTRGSLTINRLSQGSAGGAQTYLSGTTISATTIYQNGSKVTGSDIILKDNIKKYEGDALDIVNKTNIYSFNRISDPNRTEIGFIAQQVPDELIYQRGKFTAKELEGLTPEEKTALLEQAQIEANKERDIAVYDKIAEEVVPFYDLDDKQTQNQIDKIQEEANNVEYTSPVSMLHENNIIGIMWKAIQELSKKVDELSK